MWQGRGECSKRCALGASYLDNVMAGLVPAIHALPCGTKNVDARDKPGHDEYLCVSREIPGSMLRIAPG
ncbi:hypothetical protein XI09_08125 [Bradyrhizobium sp. CCBAU 11386]|nr:hypothetical protein [Bradyrhizobium sp. CCBAU 11386]